MPRIGEFDQQARQVVISDLHRHTEVLRELHITAADRAQRYILLINGGAVVASLSFMGTSAELRAMHWMWIALSLFLLGVVACGIVAAITYHRSQCDLLGWIRDFDDFVAGKVDIGQPSTNLNSRTKRVGWVAEAFAYLAFVVFIGGVAVALIHMP